MSKKLVLDWDDQQVRLLLLDGQGAGARVLEARTAPLEGGERSATAVASALKPLVAPHRAAKTDAIVIAGGRDVQFRLLRIPPVPADELPDLVRMRATAEFPLVDDQGIIDFHLFPQSDSNPPQVLAARLAAKSAEIAGEVCKKLQLTPLKIIPRGVGIASFAVARDPNLKTGVHVVVGLRSGAIDLVALQEGAAAIVRSLPLAAGDDGDGDDGGDGDGDEGDLTQPALRELRRTLAAVTSELGVEQVDSIVWLSGDVSDADLAHRVAGELGQSIETLDVDQPAEFAGLVGACDAAPIDFLSPKRPIETRPPTRTLALAGAAALLLVAFLGWWIYDGVARIERETLAINEERSEFESEVEELAPELKRAEKVEAWLATDVNWLDELDQLAVSLRPKELDDKEFDAQSDVLLTSLVAAKTPGTRSEGGTLALKGRVRDDGVLEALEERLRDDRHEVDPKSVVSDPQSQPYIWTFQTDIAIQPRSTETDRRDKTP